MEQTVAFAAITFLVSEVIAMLKYLRNADLNAAVTLAITWVAGIIGMFVAANNMLTENVMLPTTTIPLSQLDGGALCFLGLTLASTAAFAYDTRKSIDNHDSAKQPPLLK